MTRKMILVGAAAAYVVFSAGWTLGSTAVADRVNSGLAQAMNSVGQNLFGSAVFGVGIINPDIMPGDDELPTVQIDFADISQVPVLLNLFNPPTEDQPLCAPYMQIAISPEHGVDFIINPEIAPEDIMLSEGPMMGAPPNPCNIDGAIVLPPLD